MFSKKRKHESQKSTDGHSTNCNSDEGPTVATAEVRKRVKLNTRLTIETVVQEVTGVKIDKVNLSGKEIQRG